jgi:hypothetical protein
MIGHNLRALTSHRDCFVPDAPTENESLGRISVETLYRDTRGLLCDHSATCSVLLATARISLNSVCDLASQPRSLRRHSLHIAQLLPGPRKGTESCSSCVAPTMSYAVWVGFPIPRSSLFAAISALSLASLRRCNAPLHDFHSTRSIALHTLHYFSLSFAAI